MLETKLYTKDLGYVSTVFIPDFKPKAEVVQWGQRHFVWRDAEQKYIEGLMYIATVEEINEG